jgi:hypothetical protein
MNQDLSILVRTTLERFDPESLEPFWRHLREIVEDRASAILAYGSCLSDVTRSSTSTPDFYVVVDRYSGFHGSVLHAVVNWILPPSIYHFSVEGRTSKFNVISMPDLMQGTSPRARDVYQLGRFSKRVALLWTRDERSLESISQIQVCAMRTVARKVYDLLPDQFTIETFVKESLRISYYGDVRVEADDKIDRLWKAEEAFYRKAYGFILDDFTGSPLFLKKNVTTATYEKTSRVLADRVGRFRVRFFLARSRLRAQLRWPKGMFTVDNWLDYLIRKIERTQGIRLELTPKEKRLWFIYGWKYFFRLRRQKLIK